jgi:uncharacterized protein (TIGR03435 family)
MGLEGVGGYRLLRRKGKYILAEVTRVRSQNRAAGVESCMSESTAFNLPKTLRTSIAVLLPIAQAFGQAETPPLRFEVCDIQPSKIRDRSLIKADFLPGGRVEIHGVPLINIIATVNGISETRVIGPHWMSTDQYDVVAKAPPDSTESQLYEMARNELEERFKMVAHTGKKEMSAYVLVQGSKGVNLTPATESATSRPAMFHDLICPGNSSALSPDDPVGTIHRKCFAISMADLAKMLPQIAPAYLQDQPVVDLTGLTEGRLRLPARLGILSGL